MKDRAKRNKEQEMLFRNRELIINFIFPKLFKSTVILITLVDAYLLGYVMGICMDVLYTGVSARLCIRSLWGFDQHRNLKIQIFSTSGHTESRHLIIIIYI